MKNGFMKNWWIFCLGLRWHENLIKFSTKIQFDFDFAL